MMGDSNCLATRCVHPATIPHHHIVRHILPERKRYDACIRIANVLTSIRYDAPMNPLADNTDRCDDVCRGIVKINAFVAIFEKNVNSTLHLLED
jgi:hypothetical protein